MIITTMMMEDQKEVLETNDFFSSNHLYQCCPTFWGTEAEGNIVKHKILTNCHPTLKDNWNKLECLCGLTPTLKLVQKPFVSLLYLTCGSIFPDKLSCSLHHSISRRWVQKQPNIYSTPSLNLNSMSEQQPMFKECYKSTATQTSDVAPLNSNHPFAVSARAQERERNMFAKATFNPWGNPDPEEDAPYLAVTEDGYVITQDGCYEKYPGLQKMSVASPRFKQLYKYHKKQSMTRCTPVTEKWLEQRYGTFLLPQNTMRRQLMVNYHTRVKHAMEVLFSLDTLEKQDGHRIKCKVTHRFDQLCAYYRKQKWQVDMAVTEEWLENHYGKHVPKDTFCLSERYLELLNLQDQLPTYQEWLERTIGCLVPRSLPGKRLHHLLECYHYNKHLSLTNTALERTYGPLLAHDDGTVVNNQGDTAEFMPQEKGEPATKKRKNSGIV